MLTPGNPKEGIVRVTTEEEVEIGQIEVQLRFEVTGKLSPEKRVLDSKKLLQFDTTLLPGKTYEYPFSLSTDAVEESYDGKNASAQYLAQASIRMADEPEQKNFLERAADFLTGSKGPKTSVQLEAINSKPFTAYAFDNKHLKVSGKSWLTLLLILLFLGISLFIVLTFFKNLVKEDFIAPLFFGLIGSILLGIGAKKLIVKMVIGRFKVYISDDEDPGFICEVESEKGWKAVDHSECYYTVKEKVVDDRGTSTSTYYHTIYESARQHVKQNQFGETKFVFDFPDEPIPIINASDVSIQWQVVLEIVTFMGFRLKHEALFGIKKKGSNSFGNSLLATEIIPILPSDGDNA